MIGQWIKARRVALLYALAVLGFFFVVYALYGHPWGVAGYAALLSAVLGLVVGAWDFARFVRRHAALGRVVGNFPTGVLPEANSLLERDYGDIISALEVERARLEREGDLGRRDAEEYYTLWAHQIKTPIAGMRLLLQSAGEDIPAQRKRELEQELFRIGQYVDMVLQYQRLSSLEGDLRLEPHALATLVKRAARECAPLFIYKGLALEVSGVSGELVTDAKWFCFVLEQLLTNAVKYTKAGTVRVYSAPGSLLVVEDTGIGIAPADLPRVFERGFTGAIGRSERSSTGIGLYLSRRILAKLGFSISIASEQGRGTRVLLHLAQNAMDVE